MPIPIEHNLATCGNCVVKITNIWVGSCEIPSDRWQQLVTTATESLILLEPDTKTCDLEFFIEKEGAYTFNIGMMLDNGCSTSGLVSVVKLLLKFCIPLLV